MFKVAVVGSGPSGLFLCKNLLKSLPNNVDIDVFEKLPEPLGLIRFGVAPDHSEIKKKFTRHFDSIFDSRNVKIYTNADIGRNLKVSYLSRFYDAIALCTGMSNSNRNWQGIPNCYGADDIFGWYNQNPVFKNLNQDLSKVKQLVIIGNGNVALDMARIFAKTPPFLDKDTIAPEVLRTLESTNIKDITLIGRRDLKNASFTPSELREFKILKDYCKISASPEHNESENRTLSRVQAKNIQIMKDLVQRSNQYLPDKNINFRFSLPISSVNYENQRGVVKFMKNNQNLEHIEFDLLIECTGFNQTQIFEGMPQDEVGKFITNDRNWIRGNIYACGWARTGSRGNIADSMSEASNCATSIITDLLKKGKTENLQKFPTSEFTLFDFKKWK